MRPSVFAVIALLCLTGCGSNKSVTANANPARVQHPATQTASATHAQPTVAGPAVVLAIAPTNYPPVGSCRVWIPNAPTGEQQAPCDCFSLILDVPLGAWVLYRPSSDESVLQVSQYDSSRPNVIKSVDLYDAKTGKFLRNVRHTG